MLLGVSGVGKSSLLQQLCALDMNLSPFVHIAFPTLSAAELNRALVSEVLGSDPLDSLPMDVLLLNLHQALRKSADVGLHAVIAFDEAHLLSNDTLNQVVLPLLNLADTDHQLSYSVVLSGQPVLASHIARNAQLRERIAVTATMERFSDEEVADYIQSRMHSSGARRCVFTAEAVETIVQLSEGNPRRINRLCDMALLVGYADQVSQITEVEVRSLSAEILPAAA